MKMRQFRNGGFDSYNSTTGFPVADSSTISPSPKKSYKKKLMKSGGFEDYLNFEQTPKVETRCNVMSQLTKLTHSSSSMKSRKVLDGSFDYNTWLGTQERIGGTYVKLPLEEIIHPKVKPPCNLVRVNIPYKSSLEDVPYVDIIAENDSLVGVEPIPSTKWPCLRKLVNLERVKKEMQYRASMKPVRLSESMAIKLMRRKKVQPSHAFPVKISKHFSLLCGSYEHDPMKQSLAYSVDSASDREEEEFVKQYVESVVNEMHESRLEFPVPASGYSVILRSGGRGSLSGLPMGDDLSCIYLSEMSFDEVFSKLLDSVEGFSSLACIPPQEIQRYYEDFNIQLPPSCYQVFFSRPDACTYARKNDNNMRPYLVKEDRIASKPLEYELRLNLKWYTQPYKGRAKLKICNPKEIAFVEEILIAHGINAFFYPVHNSNHIYSELEINWGGDSKEAPAHDEEAFKAAVDKILTINNIQYQYLQIYRFQKQIIRRDQIIRNIHIRLVRASINSGTWNLPAPTEDEHWDELLSDPSRLPWDVTLSGSKKPHEGSAKVIFRGKKNMALSIMTFLVERSPYRDTFSLNYHDRLGVRFYPIYRRFIHMPREIRAACQEDIILLDRELRKDSDYFFRRRWLRLADAVYMGEGGDMVMVEGWPLSDVEQAFDKLRAITSGKVFNCNTTDEEMILTGFGVAWLKEIEKNYRVIININRLQKQISVYGCKNGVEESMLKINSFVNNWKFFHVESLITLDFPRFPPSIIDVWQNVLPQARQNILGGSQLVTDRSSNTCLFRGQLLQYFSLLNFLEALNDTIEELFTPPGFISRPMCPICLSKVDQFACFCLDICGHYYCLSCVSHMILSAIRTRDIPIKCQMPGCSADVPIEDIMFLLIGHTKISFRYFFDRYKFLLRSVTDNILAINPHLRICGSPDCTGILMISDDPNSIIRCNLCNVKRCGKCCEAPHADILCEDYRKLLGNSDLSMMVFKKSKGNLVRDCPNNDCSAVIEKDAGCNHVQCYYCKLHFCWLCGFISGHQRDIYVHLNSEHGGSGGGWQVENGVIVGAPEEALDEMTIALMIQNL